jgi:N-acyl-D-aspartate/D-glutamate deacylase
MAPREAQPQAYFKNFEAASAEDLERIVADFEHLLGIDSSGEH